MQKNRAHLGNLGRRSNKASEIVCYPNSLQQRGVRIRISNSRLTAFVATIRDLPGTSLLSRSVLWNIVFHRRGRIAQLRLEFLTKLPESSNRVEPRKILPRMVARNRQLRLRSQVDRLSLARVILSGKRIRWNRHVAKANIDSSVGRFQI